MDRDFRGSATHDSEWRAEQSSTVHAYVYSLVCLDEFASALAATDMWATLRTLAGLAVFAAQRAQHNPRLAAVCHTLAPALLAALLRHALAVAPPQLLAVCVHDVLARQGRVLPLWGWLQAAGTLQQAFVAAALQQHRALRGLLRGTLLRAASPATDPLKGGPVAAGPAGDDAQVVARAFGVADSDMAALAVWLLGAWMRQRQRETTHTTGQLAVEAPVRGSEPSLAVAMCDGAIPTQHAGLLGGQDGGAQGVLETLERSAYDRLQSLQSLQRVAAPRRPASSSRPGTPVSGSETASPAVSPSRQLHGEDPVGAAVTVLVATLTALVKLGTRCPAMLSRVGAVVRAARDVGRGVQYADVVVQRAVALQQVLDDSAALLVWCQQRGETLPAPCIAAQ